VVSALAGVAFVLLTLWSALFTLFIAAFTCDESCEGAEPPPGADWAQYSESAQWSVIAVRKPTTDSAP
jgi:hypothetical protein